MQRASLHSHSYFLISLFLLNPLPAPAAPGLAYLHLDPRTCTCTRTVDIPKVRVAGLLTDICIDNFPLSSLVS